MGRFDGTKICELAGVYILRVLGGKFREERIILYRENGSASFENLYRSQAEKVRKDVSKTFNH